MDLPNQPESHDNALRARELFNYFQPDNPALLPTRISSFGPEIKASPNLVLTSLTQLAALKLGVQRAIISLIGRETLYVVAEATRSLHLGDNSVCDNDGDSLWMGCSNGPLAGTLCEETITLHPTAEERHRFFIVEDLKEHPTYCKIPCVDGAPHFRYYAGTPLTTASGINIGSLYVIDPRPNICLSELHKETLGVIGAAVMEYLETSRQSLESRRLANLLTGLNSFVQGEDSVDPMNESLSRTPSSSELDQPRTCSPLTIPTERLESENTQIVKKAGRKKAQSEDSPTHNSYATLTTNSDQNTSFQQSNASKNHSRDKNELTFQRAAQIMRKSLDLGEDGGVVIFDSNATVGLDPDGDSRDAPASSRTIAKVCAISRKHTDTVSSQDQPNSLLITQMDRGFLKRILRRFDKGAIWYFHEDGTLFSSDDDTSKSESEGDETNPSSQSPSICQPRLQGVLREKDLRVLRNYFPDATRIIFTPLWDSFKSKWFGGCFCWSSAETRIFSAHVELGGVLGFGSSLMMEHSRIQSHESDKKKTDFISNISHELRSPLHGILAASEFLAEQVGSELPKSLLDTISACSQTLLDTFEQILDFTKINSFQKKRRDHTLRLHGDRGVAKSHSLPESLHILKVTNIVAVIEDVIESIVFGATRYKGGLFDDTNSVPIEHVDVSIDVAPGDWVFVLDRGALRRIVMNIFSNALKYTKEGSVSVRIEIQKGPGNPKIDNCNALLLTVSDTGRGISSEYLRSDLFTAFSQEDPLAPGTGLGMSIVQNILRYLGGNIKIKSQPGIGTTAEISIPITCLKSEREKDYMIPQEPSVQPTVDDIQSLKREIKGKTVSFLPFEGTSSKFLPSTRTITNYLTLWYGVQLQPWSLDAHADFTVIDETQIPRLLSTRLPKVLVLYRNAQPSQSIIQNLELICERVEWLHLPCGPHKLARAIQRCLQGESVNPPSQVFGEKPQNGCPDLGDQQTSRVVPLTTAKVPLATQIQLSSTAETFPSTLNPHETDITQPQTQPQLENKGPLVGRKVNTVVGSEGLRILLVEDNPINMALLQKLVARRHPSILHAAVNGQKAVEAVKKLPEGYHLIFMDMSMPVMDGFEATEAIRALEAERQSVSPARIIALTGLGSDEHVMKAYAAGVDVFVTKPVSFKEITRLMDGMKNHPPYTDQ
ncbi:CheY-like superfamily [Penicillium italicum]|uniref:histidine kinase n=1 Tax=Penicillium italicum TaxID=40296 RepID=A0A0A2L714_PENIT|nr:CheY-like superfamily [Penicillium italicum]